MSVREVNIRYVNFGTRFQHVESSDRSLDAPTPYDDSRLYRNEFAFDVGGICHGHQNQTAWILDHHFNRGEDNFPSASAAVLHKADALIAHAAKLEPQPRCFWLVTHVEPDFDALLSVYLAKFLLQQCAEGEIPGGGSASFVEQGLHPDGWRDFPPHSPGNTGDKDKKRFPWFEPPLEPGEKRWMLLLASIACHVDNGRPLHCRLETSLPSVFYAALKRQRPYKHGNGAEEFFDAARERIMVAGLNPRWDPLFGPDSLFAPELTLLAGSEAAYARDVARARKSIVHLPYARQFLPYHARMMQRELLTSTGQVDDEQVSFALSAPDEGPPEEMPSRQAGGIWIRDPECLLFREYARADRHNAPGGQGFLFTAIAYSGGKTASRNRTDYFFSLDPDRAAGRHLYPVWATLQAAEIHEIEKDTARSSALGSNPICRKTFEGRAGSRAPLFRDPWFDGSNYEATIVATPNDGTAIQGEGTRPDLSDDAVARLVADLLENRSLTGKVSWRDFSMHSGASGDHALPEEHVIEFRDAAQPIPTDHVRFVAAELASDIDLSIMETAAQAGRQLWQFLYTDAHGGVPTDFVERHLILDPDVVCVWGRRGIGMAAKPAARHRIESVQQLLTILTNVATNAAVQVAALKQHLEGKCCEMREAVHGPGGWFAWLRQRSRTANSDLHHSKECQMRFATLLFAWLRQRSRTANSDLHHSEECQMRFATLLEDLQIQLADVADLQRQMAQPEGRFLFPFYQASRLGEVLTSVRDSHNALSTRADNRTMRESLAKIQEVEENTDWLEIIIIGVYLLELVNITSQPESRQHPLFLIVSWIGGMILAFLLGLLGSRKYRNRAWNLSLQIVRAFAILWVIGVLFTGLFWNSIFPETRHASNPPQQTVSSQVVDKTAAAKSIVQKSETPAGQSGVNAPPRP
jgi:hypothetical protein